MGEIINCTARGSPEPDIRWEAVISSGPTAQSSQQLLIKEDMIGENRWKCVASNTATQFEFEEEFIDFTVGECLIITRSLN